MEIKDYVSIIELTRIILKNKEMRLKV